MTLQQADLENIVAKLTPVIKQAGAIVMDVYAKPDVGSMKKHYLGREEITTDADFAAQEYLKEELKKLYPRFGIIAEEDANLAIITEQLKKRYVFNVDPLDGSVDFENRTGEFTNMISLFDNREKKVLIGMTYKPPTKELVTAIPDGGTFMHYYDGSKVRLHVSDTENFSESIVVTSKFHKSEKMQKVLPLLKPKIKYAAEIGSGGNKMAFWIAPGQANIYFRLSKVPYWDIMAGHLIVEEAGGKLTDLQGNPISYAESDYDHKTGILVTNGKVHDVAKKEIQDLLSMIK